MSEIYYFGCVGGIGHHLHKPSEHGPVRPDRREHRKVAWMKICDGGLGLEDIDGGNTEGCGIWAYVRGYSIVSFWDRSIDSRGGSTSSFLVKGLHSFAAVLECAENFFPNIFKRYTFKPIIPVLNADVADDIGFISAVESFRVVLAMTRGARGRDFIRGQKYGLLLDALDAGAEKMLGTDMDERTHGDRSKS